MHHLRGGRVHRHDRRHDVRGALAHGGSPPFRAAGGGPVAFGKR